MFLLSPMLTTDKMGKGLEPLEDVEVVPFELSENCKDKRVRVNWDMVSRTTDPLTLSTPVFTEFWWEECGRMNQNLSELASNLYSALTLTAL